MLTAEYECRCDGDRKTDPGVTGGASFYWLHLHRGHAAVGQQGEGVGAPPYILLALLPSHHLWLPSQGGSGVTLKIVFGNFID